MQLTISRRRVLRPRAHAESLIVGALALALAGGCIAWTVFHLGLLPGDAVSRSYLAWRVFFAPEPKLVNLGFVWMPLPGLLQLPLDLVPPLRVNGLAGSLVTAGAAALAAIVLNGMARREGWPRPFRYALLASLLLNPTFLLYSANGMSEMPFILCILATLALYLEWRRTGRWLLVSGMGITCSFAFLCRYEGLWLAVATAAVLVAQTVGGPRIDLARAEGTLLAFLVPVAYFVFLWLFLNWLILGDALYFARGPYSNFGLLNGALLNRPWLIPIRGDLVQTLRVGLASIAGLYPAFLLFSLGVLVVRGRPRATGWSLVLMGWAIPAFAVLNLYLGQSLLWLRYFMPALPAMFATGVWLAPRALSRPHLAMAGTVVALALSAAVNGWTLHVTTQAEDFSSLFVRDPREPLSEPPLAAQRALGGYIRDHIQGQRVLMDDEEGHYTALFAGSLEYFLVNGDRDFATALHQPYGRVDYILVAEHTPAAIYNQISLTYPDLYARGGVWVRLEFEAGPHRLYRVIGPPGTAEGASARLRPPEQR